VKKSGGIIGKLLIGLVILAVTILAASGIIGSRLNEQDSSAFNADLAGFENASFATAGSGFAAVSDISCRLYGSLGETLCTASRSYSKFQIGGAEGCAAVWSEGGTDLTLLRSGGAADFSFPGGITAVDVNDEGSAVVLSGEIGYKGSVTVIDAENNQVFRVYVGSGYPLDTAISPDSRRLAILCLTAEGCSVLVYNTDREEVFAAYSCEDSGCFAIEYLTDGKMMLTSFSELVFLKDDGKELGRQPFDGDYLQGIAKGSGFAALLLGRYNAGGGSRILVLDTSGSVTSTLENITEAESISAAGEYLAVRYGDAITVYDKGLNELGSLQNTAGIQAAFMRADGNALIISGGGAAIFEP